MEEVLFRLQKPAFDLPGHCLDSLPACKHSKSVALQIRTGVGLGILELLEVWPTPAPVPGSKKSYDSQGETSFTAKVKENQELHFCMLTDDYISFGAGIISRGPQSCNLKSHLWDVG